MVSCILGKEKKERHSNRHKDLLRTHLIGLQRKPNEIMVLFSVFLGIVHGPLVSVNDNHYSCHHYYQERDFFRLREKSVRVLWTKGKGPLEKREEGNSRRSGISTH